LKLEPIIQNDAGLQDGVAHISVVHCEDNGSYTGQKRHRIFDNVPGADLQPPENVANMQLEVVRFYMDILEPKQRPQLRRSNTSAVGSESSSQHPDPKVRQDHDLDEVLQEPPSPNHGLSWETATHSQYCTNGFETQKVGYSNCYACNFSSSSSTCSRIAQTQPSWEDRHFTAHRIRYPSWGSANRNLPTDRCRDATFYLWHQQAFQWHQDQGKYIRFMPR
jgi:hypothetical protein